MKVRAGFVTNSSSTSFLLVTDEPFEKDRFLRKLGVSPKSPLFFVFESLYSCLKQNMQPIQEYCQSYEGSSVQSFVNENYPPEILSRIQKAEKEGKKVYAGKLSTESGDGFEAFFCTDCFLIDEDGLYLNGVICYW